MISLNYPGGPNEPWDDTTCANCGSGLPDEEPDEPTAGDLWNEGFCSESCRKGEPVPSDEDQLMALDAYGHLTYVVGFSGEVSEDRGDWMACFDFRVWKHPSRGVLVAYHVVVDSDSGGFIDTLESGVVEADKAPFDLPDYWTSVGMEHGTPWTEQECEEANECQTRWAEALKEAINKAQGGAN